MVTGRLRGSMPTASAPPGIADGPRGLADAIGARVYIDIVIPRTSIVAKMRLLTVSEDTETTVATQFALSQMGIDGKTPNQIFVPSWNAEHNARVMSLAVRDPKDVTRPLDSIEEWRELDRDQIDALLVTYNDLAHRIDPLGSTVELTEEEFAEMSSAAKKKLDGILLSYGSRKLALFAISMAERPAS